MNYKCVIGLEVHVELLTESKMFCSCKTKFGEKENTQCCPVCTGMPGALPTLNKQAVKLGIKTAKALNCKISRKILFDRKNYFYPDLPKAYQISQFYTPLGYDGFVMTDDKKINIKEMHLEEDAGKLIHSGEKSYIDFNRCSVPLVEIVTQPDFENANQVIAFLQKIKRDFEYLDVSDCKMQEGSMRVDVNLSLEKDGVTGNRTETKNLNSFKTIEKVIELEIKRQSEILDKGGKVLQQTLRFDETEQSVYPMREKENVNDYRYFPDPDLPVIVITDEEIDEIVRSFPMLADQREKKYINDFNLTKQDASCLTQSKIIADLFDYTQKICNNALEVKKWILGPLLECVNDKGILTENIKITPYQLSKIINLVLEGKISRQSAKLVLSNCIENENFDIESFILNDNLILIDESDVIENAVKQVIEQNKKAVSQYKQGENKVFTFLVGQCMKKLKGNGKAQTVNKILKEYLSK
ncbi:MAG: Asp-tRNA(Asn)/Glu-tRNA(Gln) amidotransferase subunit GatB [Acutalibacteraceae bacterium]|nr:Asp-tRNA(Asn)/Glu-tRNA(Gln) amidotransferase subunit GatB [Acutalibacteraceae bacterium]